MKEQFIMIDIMDIGPQLYAGIKSTIPYSVEEIPNLANDLSHVYRDLVLQVTMLLDLDIQSYCRTIESSNFPDMSTMGHIDFLKSNDARIKLKEAVKLFAVQLYPKIKRFVDLGNPLVETMPENSNLDHLLIRVVYK